MATNVVETGAVVDLQSIQTLEVAVSEQMARSTRVYVGPGSEMLVVPVDRVRLRLREYDDKLRARASWQGPAGILASLVAALVAADFKNKGLPAATWEALFILLAIVCIGLLIRALFRAYRARSRGNDIEALVERLRQ